MLNALIPLALKSLPVDQGILRALLNAYPLFDKQVREVSDSEMVSVLSQLLPGDEADFNPFVVALKQQYADRKVYDLLNTPEASGILSSIRDRMTGKDDGLLLCRCPHCHFSFSTQPH